MKGTVLGGRYELLEQIGDGGMSIVHKARCKILDRTVAVKILKEEYSSDQGFVENFKIEALAAARLSHPNIVNIYDVGQQDDIYYIVMEYVEGTTLKEIIEQEAPLSLDKAIDIAVMICDGIHHAHEKGIIHRDIKPQNILMTTSGIAKVADFGIAKAISKKTITYGGNIVGSVQYISPEQAKGEPATRATDIYSVGCVLYEMLTGQIPFDADSPITIALKHIHNQPVAPTEINHSIPLNLENIILKAMDKVPVNRFATTEEMRNALLNLYKKEFSRYAGNHNNAKTIVMSSSSLEGNENDLKKKRMRPTGIAIVVIAVLGLLFGSTFVLTDSLFGREVEVPNIVNLDIKEANQKLKEQGLVMTILDEQYSDKVEADRVISQKPPAGQIVKEGREIEVFISKGLELQKTPNLAGMSQADAELTLRNLGLDIGAVERIYDDKYVNGQIISQKPRSGEMVKKGSKVDLMVSKGKPPRRVAMPSLVGLDLDTAQKKIGDAKLLLGDIKREESSTYYTNQVISQDIEANVMVDEGSTVTLVVSNGPGPVAKTDSFQIKLPDEQEYYKVLVKLTDAKGERGIYDQIHRSRDSVHIGITYFGKATVEVFLNGKQYDTFSFK
ncbi:MAG: protein kinase domain-containing protein [Syntrophomonadaceae bacterium]